MRPISTLKISISGVRGVVGDSLTPGLLVRFAQAFGTYMGGGTVVVGRDTRTSGEMVKHAVLSGLAASGCRVIDLDLSPVPTVQMMVERLGAAGGIALTASHNPAEWNALKFIRSDGSFLNSYQAEELLDIYHQGEFRLVPSSDIPPAAGFMEHIDTHIQEILKFVDGKAIRKKKFKVAYDCCNGAGAVMTPKLLKALGCRGYGINVEPNGIFPHPPEPLEANLKQLSRAVRQSGAEIGFAQDADADRLAIVNEKGKPIGEEYTLTLAVRAVLGKKPGPVVTNLSTTMAVDDVARMFGIETIRTPIGEVNVTERMRREKAVIGGEGNGGVILPALHYGRDSFIGMALILELMALEQKSLSQILKGIPRYVMIKEKISCPSDRVPDILASLESAHRNEKLNTIDGVKIQFDDAWVHVRPSNTEPVIRIMAEGRDKNKTARLIESIKTEVMAHIGGPK